MQETLKSDTFSIIYIKGTILLPLAFTSAFKVWIVCIKQNKWTEQKNKDALKVAVKVKGWKILKWKWGDRYTSSEIKALYLLNFQYVEC